MPSENRPGRPITPQPATGRGAPLLRRALLPGAAFLLLVAAMFVLFPTPVRRLELLEPMTGLVASPFTFPTSDFYRFRGEIAPSARHITLRGDDCIERIAIDGRTVVASPCDAPWKSWKPVRVPLPPPTSPGNRTLEIDVRNLDALGLLALRQACGFSLSLALFCLAAGWGVLFLVLRARLPLWSFWIAAAAILLAAAYHLATDPWMRQNDIEGHRTFIAILLRDHRIPAIEEGWETWQPPLYYLLAAAAARTWQAASPADPARGMQFVSLAAYLIGLVAAIRFWPYRERPSTSWLGLLLLAVLPAPLFISAKISNDGLVPACATVLTIALWKHAESGERRPLVAASGAMLVALLAKTSTLPLLAAGSLFVLVVSDRGRPGNFRQRLRRTVLFALPSTVWLLWFFGRNFAETGAFFNAPTHLLPSSQLVPNNFHRFFSIDLASMLREQLFHNELGRVRESLPTTGLVSSIFSDYDFRDLGVPLYSWILPAVLPVLLFLLVGAFHPPRKDDGAADRLAPFLFFGHVAFLYAYNWQAPYASCQEARLWAPAFPAIAILVSRGFGIVDGWIGSRSRPLSVAVRLLPVPFLVLLLGLHWTIVRP